MSINVVIMVVPKDTPQAAINCFTGTHTLHGGSMIRIYRISSDGKESEWGFVGSGTRRRETEPPRRVSRTSCPVRVAYMDN